MRRWISVLACVGCTWVAACGDECSAEQRVAVEVAVIGAGAIDNVTVELESEEECGTGRASGPFGSISGTDLVYNCWEQGGGVYTVRVYSGETVHEKQIEIEADKCHIKQRASLTINLDDG